MLKLKRLKIEIKNVKRCQKEKKIKDKKDDLVEIIKDVMNVKQEQRKYPTRTKGNGRR